MMYVCIHLYGADTKLFNKQKVIYFFFKRFHQNMLVRVEQQFVELFYMYVNVFRARITVFIMMFLSSVSPEFGILGRIYKR